MWIWSTEGWKWDSPIITCLELKAAGSVVQLLSRYHRRIHKGGGGAKIQRTPTLADSHLKKKKKKRKQHIKILMTVLNVSVATFKHTKQTNLKCKLNITITGGNSVIIKTILENRNKLRIKRI